MLCSFAEWFGIFGGNRTIVEQQVFPFCLDCILKKIKKSSGTNRDAECREISILTANIGSKKCVEHSFDI
jgi:hypothetical protein